MNECKECERAFQVLSLYGISKERAVNVANGIDVLVTRLRKKSNFDDYEILRLRDIIKELGEEY